MKNKLISLFLVSILILCPLLSACTALQATDSDKLTFYCVGESDELHEFLKKYNKYCAVYDCFEDSVEFVTFESYSEMNSALATELMAGGGPDILSLTQTYPFEKLVRNNALADIDEIVSTYNADVDFSDFNKNVMNSGIVDGKRVILPLYYRLNALYTTEEKLDEFNLDSENLSFDAIFNEYENSEIDTYLLNPYSVEVFFLSFVRQYIDFYEGTADFESDEFYTLAEKFRDALLNGGTYAELQNYLSGFGESGFEPDDQSTYILSANERDYYGGSLTSFAKEYIWALESGSHPVVCPDYNRNGEITASIEVGFAINANCKKMDKAAKLIEYLLSDSSQGYFGGGREDSNSDGLSLPVKNTVFENAVKDSLAYNTSWGYRYSDDLVEQKNKALTEQYLPMIENISSCNLYGYFSQIKSHLYQNVIGDVINDYLNGKITTNKFVQRLTSAVTIYMNE